MMEIRSQINAQNSDSAGAAEKETKAAEALAAPVKKDEVAAAHDDTGVQAGKTTTSKPSNPPVASGGSGGESSPAQAASLAVDESSGNLLEIGDAIFQKVVNSAAKRYPVDHYDDDDFGNLSWRVHLLPALGYEELYKKFNLERNWDRSPNKELIEQIPQVYQSDGLEGPYTRYLAVTGYSSLMGSEVRYANNKEAAENTVMIVESDSPTGVIWTKPEDFDASKPGALRGLGKLRGGFAYTVWGDGTVHALDMSKPKSLLRPVFRYDTAAAVNRASITAPLDAEKMAARKLPLPDAGTATVAEGSSSQGAGGGSAGRATASASSGSGSSERSVAGGSLAESCLSAARIARDSGQPADAWNWLYGAVVADLPIAAWEQDTKWVPALRRPSLGVHWAVGVAERSAGSRNPVIIANSTQDAQRLRREVVNSASPYSETLLETIEKAAVAAEPSAIRTDAPRRLPPVTYLSKSSSIGEFLNVSVEVGADVLVVFSVEPSPSGRSKAVEVLLYDVMQRNQLSRIGPLGRRAADGSAQKDELQKARWELGDQIEDGLSPAEWPVRLSKKLAAKRANALGKMEATFPPRNIIELRYYRGLGLIDDARLLQSVNALIGGEQGVNLLLGSDLKKRRVIRQWLPNDDPAEYVATSERRRRRAEEDED